MAKVGTFLLSYAFTPLVLGLHFYTGHGAFKFLFALVTFVWFLLACGAGVITAISVYNNHIDEKMANSLADSYLKFTPLKSVVGIIYQLGSVAYVLYSEWYIIAVVYICTIAIIWWLRSIMKMFYLERERAREASMTKSDDVIDVEYREIR